MILRIYKHLYKIAVEINMKNSNRKYWNKKSQGCELKKLTPEQEKEIQDYYTALIGQKIDTRWHRLLYSLTGIFDAHYLAFEVYDKLIFNLSPWSKRKEFDDKNLYRQFLKDFHIPTRVAECYHGVCSVNNGGVMREVSFKELCEFCKDLKDCIVKPSCHSSSGNGVKLLETKEGMILGTGEALEEFLKQYNENFVIEKIVHECDNLKRLNPDSCNTVRIHTYRNRSEGTIEYVSAYVRIGKKGSIVDNASAGGISVAITDKGTLGHGCTVSPYHEYDVTPTGIQIKGYKIENLDRMIETAKQAHQTLPMFDIIGWDMAIDEEKNCVIIEFNPDPDLRIEQLIYQGTLLLDKQERIIKDAYSRKFNL